MERSKNKAPSEHLSEAKTFRDKLYIIIFEADTKEGKWFDVALLWLILASVITVMLESVAEVAEAIPQTLFILELVFTVFFTIEYVARLYSIARKSEYAFSFYGIVDLLSILPTYLSLVFTGTQFLLVIRIFRLMRVFRILKLARFMGEANFLGDALYKSRHKILVFVFAVMMGATIMGTLMYIVEGPEYGFTSIPRSVYWAIVTMTTVGFGDIAPVTIMGQFLATVLMIMGYGIIAVPTGIVGIEMAKTEGAENQDIAGTHCEVCIEHKWAPNANYCHNCGKALRTEKLT